MNNRLAENAQVNEAVDLSYKILTNVRSNPFNEMEYSVPASDSAECVREILKTIYDEAIDVDFPLEYRYVSPEERLAQHGLWRGATCNYFNSSIGF